MDSKLGPGATCPRCGLPIDFLEQRRAKSGQVYYIAWHYLNVNGQRTVKKCYLGPRTYRHGQVTHQNTGVELKGMIQDLEDIPRLSDYLRGVAQALRLKMENRTLPSIHARAIAQALEELAGLIEPLRKYAEEKAKEEAELAEATAEAVNAAAPRQVAEAGQGEARKAASTQGAEDIDRELKEVLKELKASH